MKTVKVLLGVLSALTFGVVAGVLFAPQKGIKTRKNILQAGENYAHAVNDNLNGMVENVTKKIENTWHDIEGKSSEGKTKHGQTKKDV